jgi:hypothetical protein
MESDFTTVVETTLVAETMFVVPKYWFAADDRGSTRIAAAPCTVFAYFEGL